SRAKVRIVENTTKRYVTDEVCWLLLENIVDRSGGEELKSYLCRGMDGASLKHLVKCAHIRWTIEQFHRDVKQLLGLDRFEGRSWKGWQHHISMVLLAFAFISSLGAENRSKDERLPSLPAMVRVVVLEAATQDLMKDQHLLRAKAGSIAELMLRRYSD
ncbi:ISXo8 transposase, partial [mine drainage metagenome]